MQEIAGAQALMLAIERPRQMHILGINRPDIVDAPGHQGERRIEGRPASDRQVGVQQLLEHLGGGDERDATIHGFEERVAGLAPQRVGTTDGVHEDVRVDEGHVMKTFGSTKVT